MTVLAVTFSQPINGSDQFIEAMIDRVETLERKGQTLHLNIRGGGSTAQVYGMALEYPEADVSLQLIESDQRPMKAITTAVNAPVGTYFVSDSLPEMDGRYTEAQTVREGYEADSGGVRVTVRAGANGYETVGRDLPSRQRADAFLRVRRAIGPASENTGTVGDLVFEEERGDLRFIDFDPQ